MLVPDLLVRWARECPDAVALLAPGRTPLSYGGLLRQVEATVAALRGRGVGAGDRIAVVLPNGPEMAVAAVAALCGGVCAPLNPGYGADELRFCLSDLQARALIVAADDTGPARAVARELGVACFDLVVPAGAAAGVFAFDGCAADGPGGIDAGPDDVALVLHTSGTTSRPKIVPLSHRNLGALAQSVVATLRLAPQDRCLGILPLFHRHGLTGALLATLASGGSIVCTAGYRNDAFVRWQEEFDPTWTTAVPSMYQSILHELALRPPGRRASRLRFVRSASAPLPPSVMRELEAALGVPVIEAYGMTEAAHQVASNPLPPGVRKPGSVGVATGVDVAIFDEQAQTLPPGVLGEIALRGEHLMRGYERNPEANAQAFASGWFRTGDQGYVDADGYLFITGRLKEVINRGGEKVSPREVDEALLGHPAVAQAVAFAVPHSTLGEDVAAAVVLKPGYDAAASADAIRAALFGHIAEFKIPREIVVVDEVPKGPTGKVQRIGLAQRLADRLTPAHVAPRGEVEEAIASIFAEVLGVDRVGALDNFMAQGGDSLRAFQVLGRVRERLQADLTVHELFVAPTVALFAARVERARGRATAAAPDPAVPAVGAASARDVAAGQACADDADAAGERAR